jgi:DNA-binding NarL/FixJ family response regulator
VLKLLAEGYSTRDIAAQLELSVKTIETFRAQIMDRLSIHDVAGLVHYAIRQGIVPL